jgi:archaellum component FlaC
LKEELNCEKARNVAIENDLAETQIHCQALSKKMQEQTDEIGNFHKKYQQMLRENEKLK